MASSLSSSSLSTSGGAWNLWRRDRVFWAIFALAVVLGLIYNAVMLPGFGPDEPRHLAYVRLLLEQHRFPLQLPNGTEYGGAHSYHPPVYYLLLVPFYALGRGLPGDGVWHLLRLVSLGLCLAALPMIYDIAWRAGTIGRFEPNSEDDISARKNIARFAVAGVALLPIWGMTSGIINNDSALLLSVVTFVWLLVVRFADDLSWKSAALLGLVFGLGALSKATAIACDGAALLVFCWLGARAHRARKIPGSARFWARAGVTLALGMALAAPWYGRNVALYGTYQPVPAGYTNPALPAPSNGMLVMAMHPNFPSLFAQANWGIFYTLWAQRDWLMQQKSPLALVPLNPVQNGIYFALAAFVGFAGLGHLRRGPRTPVAGNVVGAVEESQKQRLEEDASPAPTPSKTGFAERAQEEESPAPTSSQAGLASSSNQRGAVVSSEPAMDSKRAVAVSYAPILVAWLTCLQVALFVHWGQAEGGRYLLPGMFGLSLFLARGLFGWFGRKLGVVTTVWCAFCLGLNALCLFWLVTYLNPTYGPQ